MAASTSRDWKKMSRPQRAGEMLKLPQVASWKDLVPARTKRPWGRWNHQYRAFETVLKYLELPKEKQRRAALVRMPTGSGKTGIMALLANYAPCPGDILVVVPPHFLMQQICDALNHDFWLTIGRRPREKHTPGEMFFPSDLDGKLKETADQHAVFVCTTQTLYMLYENSQRPRRNQNREWNEAFASLRKRVKLVLVDEGHREPAKRWARAVRSLHLPTIMFSATPYRNDLHMFRVGRDDPYRFQYKFHAAVKDRVIKDVEFVETKEEVWNSYASFARGLREYFYGTLQDLVDDVKSPKVIVRCGSGQTVKRIALALRFEESVKYGPKAAQERVIAVHSNFHGSRNPPQFFEHAPEDSATRDKAIFWVHENKLSEGLDDSRFCLLAFHEPFDNDRALVQQIGRVLRNPRGIKGAKAYVYANPSFGLEEHWKGYENFEESKKNIIGSEDIVEAFLESLPDWFYYSRRFREKANFDRMEFIAGNIRLPPSGRLYVAPEGFDKTRLLTMAEDISDLLEERDMLEVTDPLVEKHGKGVTALLVHWRIVQSSKVSDVGVFDTELIPTFLYLRGSLLIYHGLVSLGTADFAQDFTPVDPVWIERLISGDETTIKQLSLINADLGDTSVRRRAMGGRSLESVGRSLNDHLHFVSSVVGERGDGTSYYLGLTRGTVTEDREERLTLKKYQKWADRITKVITDKTLESHRALLRFARPVAAPPKAQAAHILLDLTSFFREYGPKWDNEDEAELLFPEAFTSTACTVDAEGRFSCRICYKGQEEPITGKLTYKKKRFRLESDDLDRTFPARDRKKKQKGSTFVSRGRVMRIVTTEGQVYAERRFYDPRRLWGPDRASDLNVFVKYPPLDNVTAGEKGKKYGKDKDGKYTWQEGSVFRLVDTDPNLFRTMKFTPDILVCEDLGSENADFLAVDFDRDAIAQIHCKVFPDDLVLSASSMHDVVAQAQKSIGFYDIGEELASSLADKWDGQWRYPSRRRGIPRIRKNSHKLADGAAIAEKIREMLRSTSIRREVWLVLGNAFSRYQLLKAIRSEERPPSHVIQLLYLVHSCNCTVEMMNARLRVISGVRKFTEAENAEGGL